MKLIALLAAYLGVGAGLMAGLMSGVFWLVKADASAVQEPRVAPIPPRIADSIERKMVPPQPVPVTPAAIVETKVEPEPVKPAMKEADAALTQAPRKVQIRETNRQVPKKKPRDERRLAAQEAASDAPPARPIATARTDFPY